MDRSDCRRQGCHQCSGPLCGPHLTFTHWPPWLGCCHIWFQICGDSAALQCDLLAAHPVGDQPWQQSTGAGWAATMPTWLPGVPEDACPARCRRVPVCPHCAYNAPEVSPVWDECPAVQVRTVGLLLLILSCHPWSPHPSHHPAVVPEPRLDVVWARVLRQHQDIHCSSIFIFISVSASWGSTEERAFCDLSLSRLQRCTCARIRAPQSSALGAESASDSLLEKTCS